MTEREFILDTSAVRALGCARIEKMIASHRLAVSPISFCELLSHVGDGCFAREKGRVVSCRLPKILDDPFSEFKSAVGIKSPSRSRRAICRKVLIDLIDLIDLMDLLDNSDSYEQFYEQSVDLNATQSVPMRDIGLKIERELKKHERKYMDEIEAIASTLKTGYDLESLDSVNDERVVPYVDSCIENIRRTRFHRNDAYVEFDACRDALFLQIWYLVLRAAQYVKNGNSNGLISVDPNDTEDSLLCLHLNLHAERTLVTDDGDLCKILNRGLQVVSKFKGVQPACAVITGKEAFALVSSASG